MSKCYICRLTLCNIFTPLPLSSSRAVTPFGGGGGGLTPFGGSSRSASMFTPLGTSRSGKSMSFITKDDMAMNAPDLNTFKNLIGMDTDLFDKLFSVPTDLQKSLCRIPEKRTAADVGIIVRLLCDFSITKSLPLESLEALAKSCEYRTVAKSHSAFLQGEPADALVLCISGSVSVKMRSSHDVNYKTGTIKAGGYFNDYAMLMGGAAKGTKYYSRSIHEDKKEDEGGDSAGEHGAGSSRSSTERLDKISLRETYYCEDNSEFLLILRDDFEEYFR